MVERLSERHRREKQLALGALALLLACGLAACATPRIRTPVPALLHADPVDNPQGRVLVSVYGRAFGSPGAGSSALLRDAAGRTVLEIASSDPESVQLWSDTQIVLAAPSAAAAPDLRLEVRTPRGTSRAAPLEAFRYEHFDVPSDPGTNPVPVALAIDAKSTLWLNEEFHTGVKRRSASGEWQSFATPRAKGDGVFALTLLGDQPSHIATFGESVLVDPEGRAWFTESGQAPYAGTQANHARILRLDPGSDSPQVYNVPGNQNGVIGLGFERSTGRIWFTQSRRARRVGGREIVAQRARLTSFHPDEIPSEPGFDFTPSEHCVLAEGQELGTCSVRAQRRCLDDRDCVLADRVCAPGASARGCFREFEMPEDSDVFVPGHLLMHSDGSVWYAAYWGGNHIGRLDPATGRFQLFPLARPPGEATCDRSGCQCFGLGDPGVPACSDRCCVYLLLGRGPWQLAEEASGDVVVTAQESNGLSRFAYARRDDPRCQALARGRNPCIRDIAVPGFDYTREQLAALARDAQGTLWFTQGQGFDSTPRSLTSVGFLPAGSEQVTLLPPLSYFPFTSSGSECLPAGQFVGFHGAGIAADPRTGAVWFADLCRKRLGRLLRRDAATTAGEAPSEPARP